MYNVSIDKYNNYCRCMWIRHLRITFPTWMWEHLLSVPQGRWGKVRWVGSSVVEQSEIHKLGGCLICGSGVTWQAGRTHTLTHTHTQDTLRGFGPAQNWTPKPRLGGVHGHRRCCGRGPSYLSPLFAVSRRLKEFGRYLLPIERIQLISTLWNLGNCYDLEFAHYSWPKFCSPT